MKAYENGIYRDLTEKEKQTVETPLFQRISELKNKLAETDYIACKIAEGVATKEEYAEQIEQRQKWRDEINKLESEE